VLPVLIGAACAYGLFRRAQPIYRASTMIQVEAQKVPTDYIRPTITTTLKDRLTTIEQQIANRENLERIVRETNLYPELMEQGLVEQAVTKARRDLVVEVRGGSVFSIHFKGASPVQIADVANRIADDFIRVNQSLRRGQAENTTSFLSTEAAALKQQLEEQEARVASFRLEHDGSLPEQRSANEAAIQRLQATLALTSQKIDAGELRKIILERGLPPPKEKERVQGGREAKVPPSQLAQLQLRLSELRMQYTDRHPEVIRLLAEIERVKQELANAPPPVVVVEEEEEPVTVDPVVQAQLEALRLEMEKLRIEREQILAEIATYQGKLERTARIELQITAMTRDYDDLAHAYSQLLAKRMEAELAQNLETEQQSEQFTILERAQPPKKPFAPDPYLYLTTGIVAGALLGLGIVLIRAESDQTFKKSEELQRAFPAVPVLAVVPRITAVEEERVLEEAV
jgi:polysaccharide chain length determinant protein (PEP-CTERM system associated)